MAQQLNQSSSKPASTIYTLLIAVGAVALGAALIITFMNLQDFYGLEAGDMLKPLGKAVKAAAS